MGANGKGNGKKEGTGAAPEPIQADGKARNGKARGAAGSEPPPEEAAGAAPKSGAPSAEAASPEAEAVPASPAPPPAHSAPPSRKGDAAAAHGDAPRGAAWAHPIARFEQRWTWLESRLLTFVLVWQIAALCAWVFLNGLSESVTTTAGAVFRAVILASAGGAAAWVATRRLKGAAPEPAAAPDEQRNLTVPGLVFGMAVLLVLPFLVPAVKMQLSPDGQPMLEPAGPGRAIKELAASLCGVIATTPGAIFLLLYATGIAAWVLTGKPRPERRGDLTLLGTTAAIALALLWRARAGEGPGAALSLDRATFKYFDNVKGWLQEGSTLTLLGGLRGLGTRLTLWLALLGGSLATASGKHIHVDVVFRFLPRKMRLPVSILNYLFAAVVCFAGVWGFFDHVAIESYGSRADDRAGAKIANALHHIGNHAFFTRKQIGLDLRTMPHVITGQRYDQWMSAEAWNAWVDGAGFEDRWEPAKVAALHIPDGTHPPFVVSPDGETTRSALAHTLGLVFPFGLLAIGLRFLLRALLTLSGHFAADPDEAHKEEIGGGREGVREGGV